MRIDLGATMLLIIVVLILSILLGFKWGELYYLSSVENIVNGYERLLDKANDNNREIRERLALKNSIIHELEGI